MENTEESKVNEWFDKLREFGTHFLGGFQDIEKATDAMGMTNDTLQKNPALIRFISNPENIVIFKEIFDAIKDGISLTDIPKIAKLAKKLKN
jgi:hypothetical protein